MCPRCRLAFEPSGEGLREVKAATGEMTTGLALPAEIRYVAAWRFRAEADVKSKEGDHWAPPGSVWANILRNASPQPPFIYVPAFTLNRVTVQQLGTGLVLAQPHFEAHPGAPEARSSAPRLVASPEGEDEGPGFGQVSPVLLSAADAETVAHFVYLAVETWATSGLRSIDYDLALTGAELLFLPAAYDRRYARDSFWRFLFREFDALQA